MRYRDDGKMVTCPNCHSTNIFGMYLDEYYGENGYEAFWTWEPVNSKLSMEPQLYEKFSCEDCEHEWSDSNDV